MIGNWAFGMLFYLPPIFFPNLFWLGLMPMLFGAIGQTLAHGVINNVKLKAAKLRYGYNSGLAAAALGDRMRRRQPPWPTSGRFWPPAFRENPHSVTVPDFGSFAKDCGMIAIRLERGYIFAADSQTGHRSLQKSQSQEMSGDHHIQRYGCEAR